MTPYGVEPSRAAAEGRAKRITIVMGAQSGKTETILDVAGQRLDQKPAPILYVGPNKQFLTEQFEPRVMALLDEAPTLMAKVARGKRMTKTRKVVNGVPFRLAHAGSSTALKSDPAALAFVDEYDEMKGNVNKQGGPLALVERRGDTYADFVCVVTSTPKKGRVVDVEDVKSGLRFWDVAMNEDIESPTWALWQAGSRHHWAWPCPHCAEYFIPRSNLLRFPENATPMEAERATFLECPRCGGVIEDHHKADMNERGRYVAPGQKVDKHGNVTGNPPDAMGLSYWVSGLASPFVTFGERVRNYLEAKAMGDTDAMQVAVNAGYGELYATGGGDLADWQEIKTRAKQSNYMKGQIPDGVMRLTLTIDVQRHSIYYIIRGWGARATSWLVDFGKIEGDTAEIDIWHALADLVVAPVGEEQMPIAMGIIDSGFRPGKVDTLPLNRIYEFCRKFPKRVMPSKGSSTAMRTPVIISTIEVNKAGKAARFGLKLLRLDTDHWKSWVHERVRWSIDQPGAWLHPKDISDDYCKQIVSEARIMQPNGRPEWVQIARANHYLDCEAMAAAGSHLLNMQRVPLPRTEKSSIRSVAPPVTPPTPASPPPVDRPPERPVARPQKRGRRIVRSTFQGM